jgi:hypothetical protein
MNKIELISLDLSGIHAPEPADPEYRGSFIINAKFSFPIPEAYKDLVYIKELADAYKPLFSISHITATDMVLTASISTTLWKDNDITKPFKTKEDIQDLLDGKYAMYEYILNNWQPLPFTAILGVVKTSTGWIELEEMPAQVITQPNI